MQRLLVIANETVGGEDLIEEVRRRAQQDRTSLYVVVPEVAAAAGGDTYGGGAAAGPGPLGGAGVDDRATPSLEPTARARALLRHALDGLRQVAVDVTGDVGPADPVLAAETALERGRFDGIILVTPPAGASKLIGQDLPDRLSRAVDVPVTTITAERPGPLE